MMTVSWMIVWQQAADATGLVSVSSPTTRAVHLSLHDRLSVRDAEAAAAADATSDLSRQTSSDLAKSQFHRTFDAVLLFATQQTFHSNEHY